MDKEPKLTLYEKDLYDAEEIKEDSIQIIVFRMGKEWYGVEVLKVREVVKLGKISYLPSVPDHILGIINLRGNILSVTDLKKIFVLPQTETTENTRLVIIKSGKLETGILADEVNDVIEIPKSKIDPSLATIEAGRAEYIQGECKIGDKLVGILKAEEILELK